MDIDDLKNIAEFISLIAGSIVTILTIPKGVLKYIDNLFKNTEYVKYYTHKKYLGSYLRLSDLMFSRIYFFFIYLFAMTFVNILWVTFIIVCKENSEYSNIWPSWYGYFCFPIYLLVVCIINLVMYKKMDCKFKVIGFKENLFKIKKYNIGKCVILMITFAITSPMACVVLGIVRTYTNVEIPMSILGWYYMINILFLITIFIIDIIYLAEYIINLQSKLYVNYLPNMHVTIKFNCGRYYRYELDKSDIALHDNARVHIFHSKEGPLSFGDVKEIYVANTKFIFQNDKWIRCESMN